MQAIKTGRLEPDCIARGQFTHHRCVDCGTDYPYMTQDQAIGFRRQFGVGIYCNGQNIISCPYCTPKGQRYTTLPVTPTVIDWWVEPARPVRASPKPRLHAMEMTNMWEYMFDVCEWGELQKWLNVLGSHGWEVISVIISHDNFREAAVTLKRPKKG